MYKQIIIVRKDLNMSHGKMAAQVSHGSMAFLTTKIKENTHAVPLMINPDGLYQTSFEYDEGLYEWLCGTFTKVVLQAKNKNQLLKAVEIAKELNMTENKDYYLIRDNCYTELTPEDEDGRTLTCIGFAPMDSQIIDQIGKKFHIYVD